ncbi:MAG: hypothetical protein MJZ25_12860 [Fibrobacter sp.]|nr:hypothetical protein [Fibrobacter sp.]
MATNRKLDMNKFSKIIDEDLDNFDFHQAVHVMEKLGHTWVLENLEGDGEDRRVPTELELYKNIRGRLVSMYEYMVTNKETLYFSSTGGFRIETRYNKTDGYWADIMYCPVETIR